MSVTKENYYPVAIKILDMDKWKNNYLSERDMSKVGPNKRDEYIVTSRLTEKEIDHINNLD